MSFESGSITFRMFYLPQALPSDYVERFAGKALPPISTLGTDPIRGWVTGRHQLDSCITPETAHIAGFLRMTLVQVERKVFESLLRAECRIEELARLKAEGRSEIDRRTRSEIRKEILDRLQATAQPQIKGLSIVHAPGSGLLFAEAVSDNQMDALEAAFRETMGFGLIPANPTAEAFRQKIDARGILPTSYSPDCDDDSAGENIGHDFLTWLWFVSESQGGLINLNDSQFAMMISGPLKFVCEGQGAHETMLRRGLPEVSAEAKIALLGGKKLSRAKFTLARGNETWETTVDADQFIFRGLKLPEGEKLDPVSRFQERMAALDVFQQAFLRSFAIFLHQRVSPEQWKPVQSSIHEWVANRAGRK